MTRTTANGNSSRIAVFTATMTRNANSLPPSSTTATLKRCRVCSGWALKVPRQEEFRRTVNPVFLRRLNSEKPHTMRQLADIWYEADDANFSRNTHYNVSLMTAKRAAFIADSSKHTYGITFRLKVTQILLKEKSQCQSSFTQWQRLWRSKRYGLHHDTQHRKYSVL